MSYATWLNQKSYVEFKFANSIANTPFKWNCFTHQSIYIKFQPSIMCLSIAFILIASSCFVCRVEVEPEQEAAPFVEDPETEPRQQGKQTPLIMSIKSHFPLSISYALFRMITMLRFYRIDEPIPLHDLSFVTVVSKPQS